MNSITIRLYWFTTAIFLSGTLITKIWSQTQEGCLPVSQCSENQFQCKNCRCILKSWLCNHANDCGDESDEHPNCTYSSCASHEFTCKNHRCIQQSWVCDNNDDCTDGSDELGCRKTSCPDWLWTCPDTGECIPISKVCDGSNNCNNGSDESSSCSSSSCSLLSCDHGCQRTPFGGKCYCALGMTLNPADNRTCIDFDECSSYGYCDQKCTNQVGSYECSCHEGYTLKDNKHCAVTNGEPMLILVGTLKRMFSINSTGHKLLMEVSSVTLDIEFNYAKKKIFWINDKQKIIQANIDGQNKTELPIISLGSPYRLAMDWITNTLYFSDRDRRIGIYCLDTGHQRSIITENISELGGLAVDPTTGYLFFSQSRLTLRKNGKIIRSFMDGSHQMTLRLDKILNPIYLTLDIVNQRLYWIDSFLDYIETVDYHGRFRQTILSGGINIPNPVSVSLFENQVFWGDDTKMGVLRVNKYDGLSSVSQIFRTTNEQILSMKVFHPSIQMSKSGNPCKNANCEQICVLSHTSENNGLGFKCLCRAGYTLMENQINCTKIDKFLLLVSRYVVRGIPLTPTTMYAVDAISPLQTPGRYVAYVAVDYTASDEMIYFSEVINHVIYKVHRNGSGLEPLVSYGIGSVEGIAVDWLSRNLYFTDIHSKSISVIRIDHPEDRRVLISNIGNPRAISVHPLKGWIFYTDWLRNQMQKAYIARANCDGTNIVRIRQHELGWPNFLSIDYDNERLYWADAFFKRIQHSDFNGNDVQTLTDPRIFDPFGIAVYKDYVYFTDWHNHKLFRMNKNGRDLTTIKSGNNYMMDLKIYDKDLQRSSGSAPCIHRNGGCSHFCFPISVANRQSLNAHCGCPYGMKLSSNLRDCEPNPNETAKRNCSENQYQCANQRCIYNYYRCNGENDCLDNSDEIDCDADRTCPPGYFQCNNGVCINQQWVCDDDFDCRDNSDELNCTIDRTCSERQFRCNNSLCISLSFKCDTENDCGDGSDEGAFCAEHTCLPRYFQCDNKHCLSKFIVCDGDNDCFDNSDEKDCPPLKCKTWEWMCQSKNQCINKDEKCDIDIDCQDGSDEEGCPHESSRDCKSFEFKCVEGGCIPESWKCDGREDCENGSDEDSTCPPTVCYGDHFRCKNGQCIYKSWVCDGEDDCGDMSDEDKELTCPPPPFRCPRGQWECPDGNRICIPNAKVCDGSSDCPEGHDESPLCNTDSCRINNGGCSNLCLQTPLGAQCQCPPGEELNGTKICGDKNECDPPGHCSQTCVNTIGSFKCFCDPGYQILDDRRTCRIIRNDTVPYIIGISYRKIMKTNLDTTTTTIIPIPRGHWIRTIAVDVKNSSMYLSSRFERQIYKFSFEGVKIKTILSNGIGYLGGLAVDWIGRNLYWTDQKFDTIEVMSLDGTNRMILLKNNISRPKNVVLDPREGNRFLFWTEVFMYGISRVGMDGSNRTQIITGKIRWITDMTIDYPNKYIYFADSFLNYIDFCDYDGKHRHRLLSSTNLLNRIHGLTVIEDRIYWIEFYTGNMYHCNKYNCGTKTIVSTPAKRVWDIASYSKVSQPSSSNPCLQSTCSHLCLLSPINPGYKCACPIYMELATDGKKCVKFNSEFLIYMDSNSINPLAWDNRTKTSFIPILNYHYSSSYSTLDYDYENRYLYFFDFSRKTSLKRISFSGSNFTNAWPHDFLNIPVGIAIDSISRNLFWISDESPAIEVIRLDGDTTYYRKILGNNDQPTGVFKPNSICLDPKRGYVYWSDLGGGFVPKKIAEVKMDGTGSRILIKDNLNSPNYLTKDPSASVLYWSESYLGKIMRYDISQNRREVVLENLANPKGVAVYNGFLYYTEADLQEIRYIPLTSFENGGVTLKRGIRGLRNLIVFYARHLSNDTYPCSGANYGGCKQLCLPDGEHSHKCECNTGLVKDDQGNCKAGSSLLIVSTTYSIRGYSLESNDHQDAMVPFATNRYRMHRMAPYVKENYVYIATQMKGLLRLQTDGSKLETILPHDQHPWSLFSIAVDWIAGNLYFVTAKFWNQEIKVSRLNGTHQLAIIDKVVNGHSNRQIVTSICINPIKRFIYWIGHKIKPAIIRARLDGTNVTVLVQNGIESPRHITVDILTHDVYWVDAIVDALQRINYNGGNREYIRGNLVLPVGVAVLGNNVYWSDSSLRKIFTVPKNSKVGPPTVVMSNLDSMQNLKIFDAAIQPEVSNPCSTNYGGCEQLCFSYPNNSTALCKCATGTLGPDGRSCVPPDEFLVYASDSEVTTFHLDLKNRAKPIPPIIGLSSAVSVDFDYQEDYIYFSQFKSRKLSRVKKGSTVVEDIVYMNDTRNDTGNRDEMQTASGLAVDWVGEKLYWTDSVKNKVMCMNFATSYKTLLAHVMNPRAIALNPCKGYMYWTTLSKQPKIERATMAGNRRTVIISSGLGMPSGLTIDYEDEKIFWVDTSLNRIERSNLDGNYREVIIGIALQPFSITVFGNFIYWSEWNSNSIYRAEKHTGDDQKEFVSHLRSKPMEIKVYSEKLQKCSSDPCQVFNGGCTHGCHPAPDGKAECSCDDNSGLVLANDQKMCVPKDNNCTSMHFICANGKCILKRWMCDIHDDCGDKSDEQLNICALHMCDPSMFRCDNGHCIRPQFRCDFDNDCHDNSDERDCGHPTCGPNEFECKNFRCINQNQVCDSYDNCHDGFHTDEHNCPNNTICMPGKVKCPNNNICLNSRFLCDGEDDCGENQDENPMFCQSATCAPGDFRCSNTHRCISGTWVCDGEDDCGNMEDEPSTCRSKNRTCSHNLFRCSNGRCISQQWVCDGDNDCLDGSDETEALQCDQRTCPPNSFSCPSNIRLGLYPCINSEFVCDGETNCAAGEDELQSCPPRTCSEDQFTCTNGLCVLSSYYCDHDNDCGDNSDEPSTCEYPTCNENQFVCDNKRCIPHRWVCDSDNDCIDNSDEKPSMCFTPGPTCPPGQFLCKNGECIDYSIVCNKQTDCSDGSDEEHCYINECENTELNQCQHDCVDTITSFHCECHAGFSLMTDKKACKDIDECEVTPEVCSQSCLNKVGNFTCKCNEGYQKQIDRQTCKRKDNVTPWLVFSNRYYIRELSTDGQIYRRIAQGFENVVGLDFDYAEQRLYYIDIRQYRLQRMFLNGTNKENVISYVDWHGGGLAVDWVGRKLYWFNRLYPQMFVSELNGTNIATLLTRDGSNRKGISRPRALIVDPGNGYLYWSDWGDKPCIARLGMDGSNYTLIITEKVGWPNGLTIEYETNRLWWVDAHLDYIEYANADGTNRHTVIQGNVPHIFAITIFEDWIYWTDWINKSISKANKYTGANRVTLKNTTHHPMDIHVMHPLRQRQHPNPCGTDNGGCSHLCLLAPNNKYRCLCPKNFVLTSDNRSCIANCSDSQFRCGITDDRCIPIYWKCDGEKDCKDGSDEPDDCPVSDCLPGQFRCKNENCSFYFDVCDLHDDCGDGSDEENCDKRICPYWQWKCKNNKCIPKDWKCDGDDDCGDKSDEEPEECVYRTCQPSQFTCTNGDCISMGWKCDFDRDCLDGSDESEDLNCANKTCPENWFKCATNYRCVPRSYVCDGDDDCRDYSDEVSENCGTCKPEYHQCDNNRCIPKRWLCDFDNDCGDGSDEKLSICSGKYRSCSESEFQCKNQKCIQGKWRCDYDNDCGDESDEINCAKTSCLDGKFQCNNGHCIHPSGVCNGERDCIDVSDELNCTARYPNGKYCLPNMFECKNTLCISPNWRCDGTDDCGDGSDEVASVCTKIECPPATHFRCNNFKCIPRWRLCDKVDNCGDGSDENNPQLCQPVLPRCESNQFKCKNRKCIDSSKVCDEFKDCEDASDEQGCHKRSGSVNCTVNNGGCSHNCTDLKNGGFYCSCRKGYNVSATSRKECEDIDECAEWGNYCPQTCTNLKGSFKCSCMKGYIQTVFPFHKCKRTMNEAAVYVIMGSEIRIFTESRYKIVEAYNTSRPKAVAFSHLRNTLYWTDSVQKSIYWAFSIPSPIPSVKLHTADLQEPNGISVDWVSSNIYWTDTGKKSISVATYDGRYSRTLIRYGLRKPYAIVTNTKIGWMYWTDINSDKPTIERAWMTGENREVLVSKRLAYPTGIAIDYFMENRVFWCDAKLNVIESMKADGSNRVVVVGQGLQNPVSVDIHEGHLYWLSQSNGKLMKMDKFGRDVNVTLQSGLLMPRNILVFSFINNDVKSKCSDQTTCSHLCLVKPGGYKCACPENTELLPGSYTVCNAASETVVELSHCNCQNGGTCVKKDEKTYVCKCLTGFYGSDCTSLTPEKLTTQLKYTKVAAIVVPVVLLILIAAVALGGFFFMKKRGKFFLNKPQIAGPSVPHTQLGVVAFREGDDINIGTPPLSYDIMSGQEVNPLESEYSSENPTCPTNFSNPMYGVDRQQKRAPLAPGARQQIPGTTGIGESKTSEKQADSTKKTAESKSKNENLYVTLKTGRSFDPTEDTDKETAGLVKLGEL